jgi:hypothetical protein
MTSASNQAVELLERRQQFKSSSDVNVSEDEEEEQELAGVPDEAIVSQLNQLVRGAVQLLHSVVNLVSALPASQRPDLGSSISSVWTDLAGLLAVGHVPHELHDSLLYAAARMTPRAAVAGAATATSPATTPADQAANTAASRSPAGILSSAAVAATQEALPRYTPQQLLTVFSTLTSMRVALPAEWMGRFWEYSRAPVSIALHPLRTSHVVCCCSGTRLVV